MKHLLFVLATMLVAGAGTATSARGEEFKIFCAGGAEIGYVVNTTRSGIVPVIVACNGLAPGSPTVHKIYYSSDYMSDGPRQWKPQYLAESREELVDFLKKISWLYPTERR